MKNVLDKILNIPATYSAMFVSLATVISLLVYNGSLGIAESALVMTMGIVIILSLHYGTIVSKSTVSVIVITYSAAIYTDIVMSSYGKVTEPFLLTIAAVTLFLAQTYDSNKYNYNIRSRALWSSILGSSISMIKIALVMSGLSLIVTEAIGAIYLTIFILAWRYWLDNSKKTKIISPEVVEVEDSGEFRFVYIENKLLLKDMRWVEIESSNAYPFLLNEVMKANEEDLILILISRVDTSELYDVGQIEVNKATTLPYLYMEAKEDIYYKDIMTKFVEEISIAKQIE